MVCCPVDELRLNALQRGVLTIKAAAVRLREQEIGIDANASGGTECECSWKSAETEE